MFLVDGSGSIGSAVFRNEVVKNRINPEGLLHSTTFLLYISLHFYLRRDIVNFEGYMDNGGFGRITREVFRNLSLQDQ